MSFQTIRSYIRLCPTAYFDRNTWFICFDICFIALGALGCATFVLATMHLNSIITSTIVISRLSVEFLNFYFKISLLYTHIRYVVPMYGRFVRFDTTPNVSPVTRSPMITLRLSNPGFYTVDPMMERYLYLVVCIVLISNLDLFWFSVETWLASHVRMETRLNKVLAYIRGWCYGSICWV